MLSLSLFLATATTAAAQDRDAVLEFCLSEPDACAISVLHLSDGWEAHLNPDRPQPLASAFKVLPLVAYAQAVADGSVSPDDTITREEWASLQTLDGGALASSWDYLGKPDEVTLDDLARVMIRFSDNSAADWFLRILGKRMVKARRKFVKGFFDDPLAISAMFAGWIGATGEPDSGNRMVEDYGDLGADGYRDEIRDTFRALEDEDFAQEVKAGLCVAAPWEPLVCDPVGVLTEANQRQLERRFFTRSTTRTMARLYEGILQGSLLSPAQQEVVDRHLEVWLDDFPTLKPAFSRYGLKGGGLATGKGLEVLTWAHHMRTGGGAEVVVVVMLRRLLETRDPVTSDDINAFAQQMALDLTFARSVRDELEADDERPELSASILKLKFRKGKRIVLKGRLLNTSPNRTAGRVRVSVYLSDDGALDAGDTLVKSVTLPALRGNRGKNFRVKSVQPGSEDRLLLIVVDPDDEHGEQDEVNNAQWQRLR